MLDEPAQGISRRIASLSYPLVRALDDRARHLCGRGGLFIGWPVDRRRRRALSRACPAPSSPAVSYDTLGLTPAVGRLLTPRRRPCRRAAGGGASSYGYWERAVRGDPGIVGRPILLNGCRRTSSASVRAASSAPTSERRPTSPSRSRGPPAVTRRTRACSRPRQLLAARARAAASWRRPKRQAAARLSAEWPAIVTTGDQPEVDAKRVRRHLRDGRDPVHAGCHRLDLPARDVREAAAAS